MNLNAGPGSTVLEHMWAVVPAGGAGTRLWPLSRARHPKFLHDLTGSGRTLIQATVDRLTPIVGSRVMVVTGAAHEAAVRSQLPDLEELIAEPSPKDSMAAIGLAAALLERQDPDAILGSFAADQLIIEEELFAACVAEAAAVAATGLVVTLGIEPTHPATGFGYIQAGESLDGFPTAVSVSRFVEKPDLPTATEYLATGDFRWNAGMFVVRAGVLLDLLALNHPDLASGLREIAADPNRLAEIWPQMEKIAIDHAIAEPAADLGRVAMIPGAFQWDDIGDFAALAGLQDGGDIQVLGAADQVISHEATGLIRPNGKMVAVVGIDDVVVIDTDDALLVTTLSHAQDVKKIVDLLKEQGAGGLT
jgi:mannose-1-phosphate guanylyltransferase